MSTWGMLWISIEFTVFLWNQPMDKELLLLLTPVALCHALGHVMSNVSFAAVAVSFTHTIKGDERDGVAQAYALVSDG